MAHGIRHERLPITPASHFTCQVGGLPDCLAVFTKVGMIVSSAVRGFKKALISRHHVGWQANTGEGINQARHGDN